MISFKRNIVIISKEKGNLFPDKFYYFLKIEKIENMKVGDRVRIKIGSKYTKETYKVAKVLLGELIVDVTNNPYGIGWAGYTEDKIKLEAYHLYWYVSDYIKASLEKLVI